MEPTEAPNADSWCSSPLSSQVLHRTTAFPRHEIPADTISETSLRNSLLRYAHQNKIAGFKFRVILNRMAGLQHIGNAAGYAIRGRFHGAEAL